MPRLEPSRFFVLFLVAASVFGLALVPLLLLQYNPQAEASSLRRPLISAIYCGICIAGVIAIFYPSKCRMMFQKPDAYPEPRKTSISAVQIKGHHPECEKYSANRITINNSIFCSACSGLLVGAIIAMVCVTSFSLGYFDSGYASLGILLTGEGLLLVGLAQTQFKGYLKLAVNALFVIGSCISLVETDLVGQSMVLDVYFLGLIFFILWFRISLSEWNNRRVCLTCGRCI